MSIESMAIVLHHSKAKGTSKLILLGIANHDGDGGAWPTIDTLAKYGSCGRTRVKEALAALEALGEIRVIKNGGGNDSTRNDRRPNLYELLLTCPADCDRSKHHRTAVTTSDSREERGSLFDERGSLFGSTGVTMGDHKPSLEPSITEPPVLPVAVAPATVEAVEETPNQRAQRLTRTYTDVVPMSNFPAVMGIVKKAIRANHDDQSIIAALSRLANDGRPVTTDTLRIEIEGMVPAQRHSKPSGPSLYMEAMSRLSDEQYAQKQVTA